MESKLNHLLKQWPKGTVATASWLRAQGVYRQLARRYAASGWIQPLGHGAFVRAGDVADWFGGLYALQTQLNLSVYAGGTTALSLKGLGHYLALGDKAVVSLFSERRDRPPAWFTRHTWDVRLQFYNPRLFTSSEPAGFTEVTHGEFSVRVSAPERAMLEVLHLATTHEGIVHAVDLMSGLSTLRPQVLQALLESCRSVKVKRLFLWAAESAGHPWFSRLAPERLDLGRGKRSLYRGGRFDPKYQITVPKEGENRLKVMSGLDPVIYRKPAEGIIRLTIGGVERRALCRFDDAADDRCHIRMERQGSGQGSADAEPPAPGASRS